ncbi:hypothetical protein pb186bvf_010798 [Paramecium bursaria]
MILFLIAIVMGQDMPDLVWPEKSPVVLLTDENWDSITRLGHEQLRKPWFIYFWAPWCKGCHRIVPLWEDMHKKYKDKIRIGAIDSYNQEQIGDRIGVSYYPSFVFFDIDNKMYFFNGSTNMGNFTEYVDKKIYLDQVAYDTPREVDHFKKWLRRIFSLKMIPVYIVVSFIIILTSLCMYGRKQEKKEEIDSKRLRYEIIRRQMEKEERDALKQKKD